MANNVSIELQRAREMKSKVEEFAPLIVQQMEALEATLVQNVQCGFPEDNAATYHGGYYTPDRNTIDDLSSDMLTRHVSYFEEIITIFDDTVGQK